MMSFSCSFTSSSFQKYSWRPWTHSKYETTTPPAFARTSGRTRTPRSVEDLVRLERRRPVRALADDRRLDLGRVLARDRPARARTGRARRSRATRSSSFVTSSVPSRPASAPVSRLVPDGRGQSSPVRVVDPAGRVGDARRSSRPGLLEEQGEVAGRRSRSPGRRPGRPRDVAALLRRSASRVQKPAPRPVAFSRPSEPPTWSGLPVTTPSTE